MIQNGSLRLVGLETNASLRLEGANTHSSTTIDSGILSSGNDTVFDDSSSIVIGASGTLNLDFAGIDVISALTINGDVKGVGIYDATDRPGFITAPVSWKSSRAEHIRPSGPGRIADRPPTAQLISSHISINNPMLKRHRLLLVL